MEAGGRRQKAAALSPLNIINATHRYHPETPAVGSYGHADTQVMHIVGAMLLLLTV